MSAILTTPSLFEREEFNVLVLGVGGGCLISHLHKYVKGARITGVDISESVIKMGRKHFGMPEDERVEIVIDDASVWLKQNEGCEKYDVVILDINSSDPSSALVCPAPAFWGPERLQQYKSLLV